MAQSFGLAFREARKAGLKKFQWKENWYTTKTANETSTNSHAEATETKRKKVTRNGNTGYLAKKEKDGTLNAGNIGEVTVTALRKKLDRNTPGYLPVDKRKDLVDRNGNTRVYKNYSTGLYFVVDNYGNIIGDTYDPNAANVGSNSWVINTGSKGDLARAGAGKLRNRANLNEVNLLALLKEERERLGKEGLIQEIHNARTSFANVVNLAINTPNHAVSGLIRIATDDNYSTNDYLKGFDLNHSNVGLNLTVGLGDIMGILNPAIRFVTNGAVNAYTIPLMRMPSEKLVVVGGKPANVPLFKTMSGGFYRRANTPNEAMGPIRGNRTLYNAHNNFSGNTTVSIHKMPTKLLGVESTSGYLNPKFYTPLAWDLLSRPRYKREMPTANFTYELGEGNPTVSGRILTGDFVPGTTSPNWDGTIRGGNLRVTNTSNHTSPSFGGTTSGNGKNNNSDWYLYGSYKKGGKLKLIPRNGKSNS